MSKKIVFSAMLKTLNYAPITKHRRMPSSDNACAQFWQAACASSGAPAASL